MRIATCAVSHRKPRNNARQNQQRLEVLERTLETAVRDVPDIAMVCFPGGYLRATNRQSLNQLRDSVCAISRKYKIPVAVGIDIALKVIPAKNQTEEQIINQRIASGLGLPWYAVVYNPRNGFQAIWSQRSVTSKNARLAPLHVCQQARTVPIDESGVEILICGEIFNARIRENVAGRRANLLAVVDLAHDSRRFRISETMRLFSERQLMKVFCAAHANGRGAVNYAYYPGGRRVAAPQSILIPAQPLARMPYLTMRIWDI